MISECLYIFYSFIKSVKIPKKKRRKKRKKEEVYIDILISNSFSLQFMIRKKTAYNIRLLF